MNVLHFSRSNCSMVALAAYIAQFKQSWIQESLGADDTTIWEYERTVYQVTDRFLPLDYIEFLEVMGLQTPISFTQDASMNLFRVHERYHNLQCDGERPPADILLLTVGGYNFEGAVLECFAEGETNSRSGRLFYSYEGSTRPAYLLAESLSQFLWQSAFERCACSSLPKQRAFFIYTHEPSLGKVAALMAQMGWQQYWFSDIANLCVSDQQDETALYVHESQNPRLEPHMWVRLSGYNGRSIDQLSKQIAWVARST